MSTSAKNFRSAGLQACLAVAALALPLHAQTQSPAFEVASIKRNVSGDPQSGTRTLPGGRINVTNLPLRQIIRRAYGSNDLDVEGGPGWLDSDRWDISAGAGVAPDTRLEPLLKSLLADRFKLRVHVETRERPVYALVCARGDKRLGEKIHPTAKVCRPDADCGSSSGRTNGTVSGTLTGAARSMSDIAVALSRYAGRRVFDRTGLPGQYDYEIQWSEEISIFTAVQEQLGLKFEADHTSVEVVVVDSVERPTED